MALSYLFLLLFCFFALCNPFFLGLEKSPHTLSHPGYFRFRCADMYRYCQSFLGDLTEKEKNSFALENGNQNTNNISDRVIGGKLNSDSSNSQISGQSESSSTPFRQILTNKGADFSVICRSFIGHVCHISLFVLPHSLSYVQYANNKAE